MEKKLVVFDNDGTLYNDSLVGSRFGEICQRYVITRFGVSPDEGKARRFLVELKRKWHTPFSVLALSKEFEVELEEIVASTYLKLDFSACGVRKDSAKESVIKAVPHKKVVLTNNPTAYAQSVLRHVGLEGFFERVVGMENLLPHLKPDPKAYQVVEKMYPSHEYILVDDTVANLQTALDRGWRTIWYNNNFNQIPDLIG